MLLLRCFPLFFRTVSCNAPAMLPAAVDQASEASPVRQGMANLHVKEMFFTILYPGLRSTASLASCCRALGRVFERRAASLRDRWLQLGVAGNCPAARTACLAHSGDRRQWLPGPHCTHLPCGVRAPGARCDGNLDRSAQRQSGSPGAQQAPAARPLTPATGTPCSAPSARAACIAGHIADLFTANACGLGCA